MAYGTLTLADLQATRDYAPKLAERLQKLLRTQEALAARMQRPRPGELF